MNGKSAFGSWTVWLNLIVLAGDVANQFGGWIQANPTGTWAVGAMALTNIVLRVFFTKQPITSALSKE